LRSFARLSAVASVLLLATGVIQLGLADVKQNAVEASLAEGADDTTSLEDILSGADGAAPGATTPPATSVPPASIVSTPGSTPGSTSTTSTTTTTTTTLPEGQIDYLAIGDSVMLGAAGTLSSRGYTVLAEQNRQMIDMVPVMQQLAEADKFGDPVIVHLGTNGTFEAETLDALLAPLSSVPNVIMLNVRADRSWTANNNALLAARDRPGDNIILIDWNTLSNACPGNCFASDGIHLTADGQQYYADVIGDITGR